MGPRLESLILGGSPRDDCATRRTQTFVAPMLDCWKGAKTHREAAVKAPPFSGVFRVSSWMEPRAEVMKVEGWPSIASHCFRWAHAGKEHGAGSRSSLWGALSVRGSEHSFRAVSNEPFEMEDPMRFIVRTMAPEVRRWKDISP